MTLRGIAILVVVAAVVAVVPRAFAQSADTPQAEPATRTKTPRTHASAKARRTAAPAPIDAARLPEAGATETAAERAASLERRRKAFFATKPEGSDAPAGSASPPVGVELNENGSLSPSAVFKF